MPLRPRMPTRLFPLATILAIVLSQPAAATVTVTDCTTDPHCVARGKRTAIYEPNDTVVVAGALAPLPGTESFQIRAKAIAIDGASGGQISATGKGRSIVLDAASILVTGGLHSANNNGKIYLRALDMVQMQGPIDVDASKGQARVVCTGIGCTLAIVGVHFYANHIVIDALGDVTWDLNTLNTIGPRDLVVITSEGGSIRKSGGIMVALAGGRLAAQVPTDKVDAVSEAVSFCETCQQPTPTTTPTVVGKTATPTPTTPLQTASLPLGTPRGTATAPTPTPTDPSRTRTPTPTNRTPTRTPTPAGGTPGIPTATPTPGSCCNTITGGVESTLFIRALDDIDLNHDHYLIAEGITITGGGNVNLTNAELRNDFGKCGEITVTAGGQINIQGATLVDDDCRNIPDVSTLNGREEVPHTGFADVVGFPALDD
jgi:hypothetical protein